MAQLIRQYSTLEEQESVCMLIESVDDKKDLWLIYEVVEGRTMNELLFDVLNTGSCFCAYSFICDDA